jgi:hypothetical protein
MGRPMFGCALGSSLMSGEGVHIAVQNSLVPSKVVGQPCQSDGKLSVSIVSLGACVGLDVSQTQHGCWMRQLGCSIAVSATTA